ncbi:BMP family ABC transporter substrate-binding protein [Undibacterium sp. CY18W]|uniref:BMP family ABC transporter substrate-binding protein n=2 Tax=Undibacterium hunanense TaxID=2762292 RepID=A0ABR6ZUQ2_9BURK|nr:BMP family ABC transporter substrate-binding protein [Undibacterium hunanense]
MRIVKEFFFQVACFAAIMALLYLLLAVTARTDIRKPGNAQLRVALFINGTLGDKSFFDSAAHGMDQARKTLPVFAKIIEGGVDPTRWEAALTDLADSGEYDLIITGTFAMVPYVQKLAEEFPENHFMVFDAAVDYQKCRCKNVHSMLFRQNEGAYLAGFLAQKLMQNGLPDVVPGSGLGVIGGMQISVIEDFFTGFRAGAKAASSDAQILSQFANSFSDPAAGKDIAKAQYARGVGLIFHAAGATGQGVNEAAAEARRYAIGVDIDQYALYRVSNPQRAARIVTSVIKNVDVGILRAVQQQLAGSLAYGQIESLGLAEGGVRLVRDSDVMAKVPAEVLKSLNETERAVIEKRVQVPGVFTQMPIASGDASVKSKP